MASGGLRRAQNIPRFIVLNPLSYWSNSKFKVKKGPDVTNAPPPTTPNFSTSMLKSRGKKEGKEVMLCSTTKNDFQKDSKNNFQKDFQKNSQKNFQKDFQKGWTGIIGS